MSTESQLDKLKVDYSSQLAEEILNDFHKQFQKCLIPVNFASYG